MHEGRTALVARAQAGDPGAMDALLKAAQPDIKRYARATCRAGDVDDAVQDALMILHRRVGTLRLAAALSGWMFAVVRRECLRLARKALGTPVPIESLADDARLAARPAAELRLDLAVAIGSLPDHYREVIILRDVEELTVDEISERLSLSREAVKARLHRARMLVREYLAR